MFAKSKKLAENLQVNKTENNMNKKTFNVCDVVINTRNGKEYYVTEIEETYNVDLGKAIPTEHVECRPNNLDDNLPDYNRFSIDELKLKE